MNSLKIFKNKQFGEIRFVNIDGKPYAVGRDIAKSLDYKYPADAVRNNCKGSKNHRLPTAGGKQQMKIIPEGDIYRLIVTAANQSQNEKIKKKAEQFETWVFDEVLPTIRQKGIYATGETIDKIISDPDFGIKLLKELKNEREKNQELKKENEKLKPKAEKYKQFLDEDGLMSMGQVAKITGVIGRNNLYSLLRDEGVLMSEPRRNEPYQKYVDRGYFVIRRPNIEHLDYRPTTTRVTPKGADFIFDLLREKDYLEDRILLRVK
ncbi:MAG: phage antirepressor KilAC domain-containing protein [Bacteroidales bacterium]